MNINIRNGILSYTGDTSSLLSIKNNFVIIDFTSCETEIVFINGDETIYFKMVSRHVIQNVNPVKNGYIVITVGNSGFPTIDFIDNINFINNVLIDTDKCRFNKSKNIIEVNGKPQLMVVLAKFYDGIITPVASGCQLNSKGIFECGLIVYDGYGKPIIRSWDKNPFNFILNSEIVMTGDMTDREDFVISELEVKKKSNKKNRTHKKLIKNNNLELDVVKNKTSQSIPITPSNILTDNKFDEILLLNKKKKKKRKNVKILTNLDI